MGKTPLNSLILCSLALLALYLSFGATFASGATITVEPEKSTAFYFSVENPNKEPAIYTLYIKGWHNWLTLRDSQVLLEPGERLSVAVIATPRAGDAPGTYPLEIISESRFDKKTQEIILELLPLGAQPVVTFASFSDSGISISAYLSEPLELKVQVYSEGLIIREFSKSFLAGSNSFNEPVRFGPGEYRAEFKLLRNGAAVYTDTLLHTQLSATYVEVKEESWDYIVWSGLKATFTNKGPNLEQRAYSVFVKASKDPFFKPSEGSLKSVSEGGYMYTWNFVLAPGEEKTINCAYNYLFLLLLAVLALFFGVMAYSVSKKDIALKKSLMGKVSRIKGDEEIRVCLEIINKTNKEIASISLEDFVQPLFRIKNEFSVKPAKITRKGDDIKLTWHIGRLEPKETRVFVYSIVPKVGLGGEYSFSLSRVIYPANGFKKTVLSNPIVIGKSVSK
jgi:hypothetical protein